MHSAKAPPRLLLNIPRISARRDSDGRAIHPARLLAENENFAEVCGRCKIEFIGPPSAPWRRRGQGRLQAPRQEGEGSTVPGSEGAIEERNRPLNSRANRLPGYHQGRRRGGRAGMRVGTRRHRSAPVQEGAHERKSIKDSTVYIEKSSSWPARRGARSSRRHGTPANLWSAMSMQDRHQKLARNPPRRR